MEKGLNGVEVIGSIKAPWEVIESDSMKIKERINMDKESVELNLNLLQESVPK